MRALIIDDDQEIAEAVGLTFGMTWPDSETISASSGDSGIYSGPPRIPTTSMRIHHGEAATA